MITSITGERLTPKQKAQELLMLQITAAMYRLQDEVEEGRMTTREVAEVERHLIRQKERVEKLFSYQPGSWSFG